ncbi:MAG: FAD-binding protein [Pseudomonadota bacterium]|nr:FAD-binding protein [Pseudomonadota bacterium]
MADIRNYETEVAIIGSGGAGIAAGIEALDVGAAVISFEKANMPGGAAIISGGGCCIVGSPVQKALGINDSPDLAFGDWTKWGGPSVDAVWARYYLEHSLHDLYFWAESLGVEWVDLKPQEGNSVMRWTRPVGNGQGLTQKLIDAFENKGGEVVTKTKITKLKIEDGRVVGFSGKDLETGGGVCVRSRTVVVTTGGFNSNLDMVLDVKPELQNYRVMEGSGRGSTGDGHNMVSRAGGYLTHMEHVWFYCYATPDYLDDEGKRGLVCRQIPGYIWINQQGKRFHNESLSGGNSMSPAMLAQKPPHAWAIVDTPMKQNLEIADPYYRDGDQVIREKVEELLNHSPYIKKAETLEQLADQIGVDKTIFLGEVDAYNDAVKKGLQHEPGYGKPLDKSKEFDTPPYFAIQFFPLARKNFGGIKTDLFCRILDKHFEPIPGLYGAGEACGMAGGHINGAAGLEGTMLGPSLFSGRVAGAWSAHEAGFGDGFKGVPNR